MNYSYEASKKKNSTMQIISGLVTEVKADSVVVKVPSGFRKEETYTIDTASLKLPAAPAVGMPITAIGLDDGEGVFEVNEAKQAALAGKALQFVEFDRIKTQISTGDQNPEHCVLMTFPLTKSSQISIDEAKKTVRFPANVDNKTVWISFWPSKFNHFDDYQDDGKKKLGTKAYAEMLKKKLDELPEGEVLLVTYAGRFEAWDKENQKNIPAVPTEKDGKVVYNIFANGEKALGTMLNTSMTVNKSFVPMGKNGQAKTQEAAAEEAAAEEQAMTSDEEMEMINAMG